MCKSISVSLAFLFAICVLAAASSHGEMRLCSVRLNDMLSTLCDKGFNRLIPQKRNSRLMDLDPLDPIQYIEEKEMPSSSAELLTYPMANSRLRNIYQENVLNSLTATRRRTREGIVDECCRRSCKLNELMAYCAA
ncbi:probable insulin-like peptide 2 [Drosophila montana]|uniref:probable insulin-like peptide 2 n=1 Tax=Drosophila montana TaxID=40370 RepID=UPI00313C41F3